MDVKEITKIAQDALEDKMDEDIKVLDLRGLSNVADAFVIASGKIPIIYGQWQML